METEQQNTLTSDKEPDIILTFDERRIVANLRRQASLVENGELDVTFKVHKNEIAHGTITHARPRL